MLSYNVSGQFLPGLDQPHREREQNCEENESLWTRSRTRTLANYEVALDC